MVAVEVREGLVSANVYSAQMVVVAVRQGKLDMAARGKGLTAR